MCIIKVSPGVGIKLVRSTKIYSGAVPGHGEQAHIKPRALSVRSLKRLPTAATYFNNGRNRL